MNRLSPQHMIAQSTRDTEKDYSELFAKKSWMGEAQNTNKDRSSAWKWHEQIVR